MATIYKRTSKQNHIGLSIGRSKKREFTPNQQDISELEKATLALAKARKAETKTAYLAALGDARIYTQRNIKRNSEQ